MFMGRMISPRLGRLAAGVAAATAVLGGAAFAAPADTGGRNCFMVNDWHGWSSPSPDILYLAVNFRDVYRVELARPVEGLNLVDTVLISDEAGLQSVCGAVDLRLIMTHRRGGSRQGLIVRSLTRLSPEEIAAIPRKYRPG
jgi:hypothetical protein